MTLELTTTFRGISTATLTPADAAGKTAANLRYITRESAARLMFEKRQGEPVRILKRENLGDTLTHLRKRAKDRSEEGGKNGRRVADKIMFSLPNSWDAKTTLEATQAVCRVLAPEGSEVELLAAIHTDKENNRHVHITALDGQESLESAKARRPDAKRVRRQNVIRLSESGKERPKQLRAEIAHALNAVADRAGAERVEWRSFEDRGITDREPGKHQGPVKTRLKEHHRAAVQAAEAAEAQRLANRRKAAQRAAQRRVKPKPAPRQRQAPQQGGESR